MCFLPPKKVRFFLSVLNGHMHTRFNQGSPGHKVQVCWISVWSSMSYWDWSWKAPLYHIQSSIWSHATKSFFTTTVTTLKLWMKLPHPRRYLTISSTNDATSLLPQLELQAPGDPWFNQTPLTLTAFLTFHQWVLMFLPQLVPRFCHLGGTSWRGVLAKQDSNEDSQGHACLWGCSTIVWDKNCPVTNIATLQRRNVNQRGNGLKPSGTRAPECKSKNEQNVPSIIWH